MVFKQRTLTQIADLICGNSKEDEESFFPYRSSSFLTEFFRDWIRTMSTMGPLAIVGSPRCFG
jgi:hypothetical protein